MTPLEQDLIEENDELRRKLYQIKACFDQVRRLKRFGYPLSANKLEAVMEEASAIIEKR